MNRCGIRYFVSLGILLIVLFFTLKDRVFLEMDYAASSDGFIQVFYSDGTHSFNGENSLRGTLIGNRETPQRVRINIPSSKLEALRIDFEGIKELVIYKLDITLLGLPLARISGNFSEQFAPNNDLIADEDVSGFKLSIVGDDPFLVTKNTLWDSPFSINKVKSVLLFIIIFFVGLFFFLRNQSQCLNRWSYFIITLALTLIFVNSHVVFSFDSVHYHTYLDFLYGLKPWSLWDGIRGFTFPVILFFPKILAPFDPLWAILFVNLFFFLLSFYFLNKIYLRHFMHCQIEGDAIEAMPYCCLFSLIIMLNPIVFSWYHFILTEYLASVGLIVCFFICQRRFCALLLEKTDTEKKLSSFLFAAQLAILCVLLYFSKQPFIFIVFSIFLAYELLLFLCKTGYGILTTMFIFSLQISVLVATIFLFSNVVSIEKGTGFSNMLMTGLRYFPINGGEFSFGQKPRVMYGNPNLVKVKNDQFEDICEFEFILHDSLHSKIQYWVKCLQVAPGRLLRGYWDNYLLLAGYYSNPLLDPFQSDYFRKWRRYTPSFSPVNQFFRHDYLVGKSLTLSGQNERLGMKTVGKSYSSGGVFRTVGGKYYSRHVESYNYSQHPSSIIKILLHETSRIVAHYLHLLVIIISLPLSITMFIAITIFRGSVLKIFTLSAYFVLSFFAATYVLIFTLTGSVLDRYIFPAYFAMLMLVFLFVQDVIRITIAKRQLSQRFTHSA